MDALGFHTMGLDQFYQPWCSASLKSMAGGFGPITDNRSIAIHTIQDVGHEDGAMTIDLQCAEKQELSVA